MQRDLYTTTNFILSTTLWGRAYFYHHDTGEEIEASTEVIELVSSTVNPTQAYCKAKDFNARLTHNYPKGRGWENDVITAVSGVDWNERQWDVEECFGAAAQVWVAGNENLN